VGMLVMSFQRKNELRFNVTIIPLKTHTIRSDK
jgi:hypothetical protein